MGDAARPIITRYSELTDASTVDLPTLNTPLANALAALGGGGSLTFSSLTDAATVDLPTVNGPLGTALAGKAASSHTHTVSQITDFPSLAQVAISGSFSDLSGTIANGTWQGTTIALAYGGTGATTASGARANLKVPASDPTGITGADAISNIVSLTQTEYDAIGTPDPTTLYVITS